MQNPSYDRPLRECRRRATPAGTCPAGRFCAADTRHLAFAHARRLAGRRRPHAGTARLGYAVLTDPTANDLTVTKDGRKYLIACAPPAATAPTRTAALVRLHNAIIAASAEAGFYVTTRGFTPAATDYAATAPIRLVDGEALAASMRRSKGGAALPETYQAICRQCGDVVQHRLSTTWKPCRAATAIPSPRRLPAPLWFQGRTPPPMRAHRHPTARSLSGGSRETGAPRRNAARINAIARHDASRTGGKRKSR